MDGNMDSDLPLAFRLSRLTVAGIRNLCDARKIPGASNLKKGELVEFVLARLSPRMLEEFCRAQEEIYFIENMAKAIKWSASRRVISLDPDSDHRMVDGVFTMKRSDGYEVYKIRFVNQTTEDIATSCECVDAREKKYFCPHQMAVLVRALSEGLFTIDHWTGPMTAEAEDLILANVYKTKRRR